MIDEMYTTCYGNRSEEEQVKGEECTTITELLNWPLCLILTSHTVSTDQSELFFDARSEVLTVSSCTEYEDVHMSTRDHTFRRNVLPSSSGPHNKNWTILKL
jgi:hypothetical protein